jgi:hypothetical protein
MNHKILNELLLEAKRAYKDAEKHKVAVYIADQ